jgi:hypothetical protein
MKKVTSKTGGREPAVRQMRGPGMNKGLKKPRHGQFPNPDAEQSRSSSAGPKGKQLTPTEKPSYLSATLVPTGRSRAQGSGKVLSTKTF